MTYKIILALFFVLLFLIIGLFVSSSNNRIDMQFAEYEARMQEEYQKTISTLRSSLVQKLLSQKEFDARGVLVMDLGDRSAIFSKNSTEVYNLASLTKIFLAHISLDHIDTDAVCITVQALRAVGDQGLSDGECFMTHDVIKAMLVSSSNDLAQALIDILGPSVDNHVSRYLFDWGIDTDTSVGHLSGYDFKSAEQATTSTPYDILVAAEHLLHRDSGVAMATTASQFQLGPHQLDHTYRDIETLSDIRFAKTGYTDLAGGNLLIIFEPIPGSLIGAVVLGSGFESRFDDIETIHETITMVYNLFIEY